MRIYRFVGSAAALIAIALVFWTCKDEITGRDTSDIVFPDSNISYGHYVQPLFLRSCAYSGCHGEATFDDYGFSLETYQHATSRIGIIIHCPRSEACDVERTSILVRRIMGLDGERMPRLRPPLTDNQIRGIKRWMIEGAQNN